MQRYHTKNGTIRKAVKPYRRGSKHKDDENWNDYNLDLLNQVILTFALMDLYEKPRESDVNREQSIYMEMLALFPSIKTDP